jgi:hypothetical protein
MPISAADPEVEEHTEVSASFDLDAETLVLGEGSGSFQLAHDAPSRETFTIRRVAHRAYDRDGELIEEVGASAGGAPLGWLELRYGGVSASSGDLTIIVEPGCDVTTCPAVEVRSVEPPNESWTRWEGTLRVEHPALGSRDVTLTWTRGLDGRWAGTMYYFANFGERGLVDWLDDRTKARDVENALIQRWAAFRSRRMMGGFHEMQAVLTATSEGSWAWPTTREACGSELGACYLFEGVPEGIVSYVDDEGTFPIPTGVTQLPLAVNLRSDGDRMAMRGRIESSAALHFAGDPSFELTFANDPGACTEIVGTDCVAFIESVHSESAIGGRYLPGEAGCEPGYQRLDIPWLVAGFREGTVTDAVGAASRTECRDARLPFGDAEAARNGSLAGANPTPDGRPLCRTLSALDGALVGQETLFVLFEERFHSCSDPNDPGASAYGYMLLERQPDALTAEDFVGGEMPASISSRTSMLGIQCDPELVEEVLGAPITLDGTVATADDAMALADVLRTGRDQSSESLGSELVHYYCQDTGLIDGGPDDDGGVGSWRVACPATSNVTYFTFIDGSAPTKSQMAALRCQSSYDAATETRGSCGSTIQGWTDGQRIETELVWACAEGTYCTTNRSDLLADKTFYLPGDALFLPLEVAVEEAFRYKTRFRTREGDTIGFAPVVCDPNSDLTPYCYEPEDIERLRARIDCMASIYLAYGESVTGEPMDELRRALSQSFGAKEIQDPLLSSPLVVEGFERLYAELMIMLADDAVTNAYRSRFDSAATVGASFKGSRFEPDGVDLTGVAGYELYSLYQATEYYQLALDRLYALTPVLSAALEREDVGDAANDVVTSKTVTYSLERLVRGAAQKSRAWAEIARRYHDLHRPDLALTVLGRAYSGSYLESVAIAQLMKSIAKGAGTSHAAQLELALEDAMRRYRVAMTDMRQTHETLTDDVTYFGFPADYVPFPVRTQTDFLAGNAFEDILRTTAEFLADARNQEEVAIGSSRAFDTDSASFQAELVRLQRSYEERVSPICGYFSGDDGRTYPAITTYAHRSERTALMGDPCGRTGNGEIHNQMLRIQQLASQRQLLAARYTHLLEEMNDEAERVDGQCELIEGLADFEYRQGERTLSMQDRIRDVNLAMASLDRFLSMVGTMANTASGTYGAVYVGTYWGTAGVTNAAITGLQSAVNRTEHEIGQIQLDSARWRTKQQCQQIRIDSEVLMRSKLRQVSELELETEQLHLSIALADADLRRAMLEAQRIQQNLAEAEQLSINVEAARNDPNVRLYRNDAILNADRSFDLAVRHAYRATRVFEYYSSQSYPGLERLFQIRMVSRGEDNLDRYMADLRSEYLLLEEELHAPASRVERLSLMNDILGIPLLREDGTALSQVERERLLRARLTDPTMLDAEGRLSIPFHTSADELSPCTRNHKLNFIEVAIQGSGLGDDEANVNIWQEGTGVIESLGGGTQYYRLPAGLSVVQAYFGRNNTVFDPSVYRRYELNDRPYINTQWRMMIDQRHDRDNQDIDLNQITDVYLYLYYLDFTDPTGCGG